jgi:hypothetical protein
VGASGNNDPVSEADWQGATGWSILLPGADADTLSSAFTRLKPEIERIPAQLEGLV